MGREYDSVAGFTVQIPSDALIAKMQTMETEDETEVFDKYKIRYATYGSAFSGDQTTVPLLVPKPVDVDKQIADWLAHINQVFSTQLTAKDVEFLSEVSEW